MGWFKNLFEQDDWRLCGTIEMPIVKTGPLIKGGEEKGTLYYYLYENQHGGRKFDVADTFRGDLDLDNVDTTDIVYRAEEYLLKVKPWLAGRKITGITTYSKVPMHDFKSKLENGE